MTKFSISRPIFIRVLISLFAINRVNTAAIKAEPAPVLNVAVIGAGTSGLVSAKYALAQGYNVTVYEQAEQFGGIWWYTDKTGKDQYGQNVHSAMYLGLRTNLPHQVMEFNDHPYPNGTKSYPPQADVLKYLHSYADRFGIKKHIKLSHLVIRVLPIENDKWEVIVKDLPNDKFQTLIYDVVFVANGHFASPRYPSIPGLDEFKGKTLHSHDYRSKEEFHDENVLVIGAGPSGMDIVFQLSKVATRITFSQFKRPNETKEEREKRQSLMPPKTTLQDNVERFTPTGAEFIDGTHETFSLVIFATGYNFTYPFLSVDTGITVEENTVLPLYKQVFNIEHPTMIFIGVPFTTCTTRLYDLQVRFAMKFLTGEKQLPSKSDMLTDMQIQLQNHWGKGYGKRYTHYLGVEQNEYFKQLAETADVEPIPEVLPDMHFDSRESMKKGPSEFRKFKYIIIDDKTFTKEREED
ncbi:senecionine N-oxygenase-like [Sitodiplosis mosellana]|uniref:senecionine N-oxygenase-like n=2 Tax=Sitodiplosis mosellana TaxID=263140 RepID=UPI0024451BFC|nr:senecionine N-oxygenase-like [Sitodiplosis mosellana]